ncbi:MAG: rhodanese-like domain-containing protein [Dysgonamonadaceae bacterium]|jgi:rhodanese-related sulfurtransferase|nr:rhodanese-like domain-containing protein [Dysgonamonadaceae bacterium]
MKENLKSFLVSAILFVSLLFSCTQGTQRERVDFKKLSQNPNTIIIDVRTPEEFATGHIKESVNIPLQVLPDSAENLKRFENIILVCRSGNRSGNAKLMLENRGLENIYNGGSWATFQKYHLSETQ